MAAATGTISGPPWSIVQCATAETALLRGALTGRDDDGAPIVVELPPCLPGSSVLDLLSSWDTVAPALHDFVPDAERPITGARLLAPLTYPGVVLGAGANYYRHCAEMGVGVPDPGSPPFFFTKPPATTVVGDGADVPYPGDPATRLDWEAELGVVVGRGAKDVGVRDARAHVAGYLVANDLSARDRTARDSAVSPHFVYDWLGHKGQDGFCPLGPGLVPAWLVPDPQQLRIQLWVNGVLRQDAKTDDMVIGVDALVAGASATMTLRPGDVILTGTPAGVGAAVGEYLHPGDEVVVAIEGVGTLTHRVVAP